MLNVGSRLDYVGAVPTIHCHPGFPERYELNNDDVKYLNRILLHSLVNFYITSTKLPT